MRGTGSRWRRVPRRRRPAPRRGQWRRAGVTLARQPAGAGTPGAAEAQTMMAAMRAKRRPQHQLRRAAGRPPARASCGAWFRCGRCTLRGGPRWRRAPAALRQPLQPGQRHMPRRRPRRRLARGPRGAEAAHNRVLPQRALTPAAAAMVSPLLPRCLLRRCWTRRMHQGAGARTQEALLQLAALRRWVDPQAPAAAARGVHPRWRPPPLRPSSRPKRCLRLLASSSSIRGPLQ